MKEDPEELYREFVELERESKEKLDRVDDIHNRICWIQKEIAEMKGSALSEKEREHIDGFFTLSYSERQDLLNGV